jgi:hypothetical protein
VRGGFTRQDGIRRHVARTSNTQKSRLCDDLHKQNEYAWDVAGRYHWRTC